MVEIDHRIHGIPCIIKVTHFNHVKGSHSYDAPSDWDYYGYTEIEYEVLDRKGYKAPWLEKKITSRDESEIECSIKEYMLND